MKYVAYEIVWVLWNSKWYPCMIIDEEEGLFETFDPPLSSNEKDVLFIGQGKVSRVTTAYAYMREFCKGYSQCYPFMEKGPLYKSSVACLVKLAASLCRGEQVTMGWEAWANKHISQCKLVLPRCVYYALREKAANNKRRNKSDDDDDTDEESASQMKFVEDTGLGKTYQVPYEQSEKVSTVQRLAPVGWMAWCASHKHNAYVPCIVVSKTKHPENTRNVVLLSENRVVKVRTHKLYDFCSTLSSFYEVEKEDRSYMATVITALKIVVNNKPADLVMDDKVKNSNAALLLWALENLHTVEPFVFNTQKVKQLVQNTNKL